MQQLPGILGPTMHRGRDTTHMTLETARVQCACVAPTMLEELCKRIQHCCATLRRPRNKRNVGSYWLKSLTGFKLCAIRPFARGFNEEIGIIIHLISINSTLQKQATLPWMHLPAHCAPFPVKPVGQGPHVYPLTLAGAGRSVQLTPA